MKKILVTGGAGYIGSHACLALQAAGFEPIVFDNLSTGHKKFVRFGDLIEGDLRDDEAIDRAIKRIRPDAVMHFAAKALVAESVADPKLYYDNNVGGSMNLLESMSRHQVQVLIFSSTAATYGVPSMNPISEDHPQVPINPYGETKLMIEKALVDSARTWGLYSIAFRYFNASGADKGRLLYEDHEPETHLIPNLIRAANHNHTVSIFGSDYETPDGSCIRDYIHVTDLANAHVQGLKRLLLDSEKGIEAKSIGLNLGTGKGYSNLEVAKKVGEVLGKSLDIQMADRRPGDPPELVAGVHRVGSWLGWKAEHSDLENIISSASKASA